jgi:hypothetical protein
MYNFFLMPLSFYHGFEAVEPATRAAYPEQVRKLLDYLDTLERTDEEDGGTQHVALRIETKFVRAKDATAISFQWTDNPKAPLIAVREEDFLKNYPLTYRKLTDTLKRRYSNFLENNNYHKIRKEYEKEKKYCIQRLLDPNNPRSARQRFFNPNILQEFDKHYTIRTKLVVALGDTQTPDSEAATL